MKRMDAAQIRHHLLTEAQAGTTQPLHAPLLQKHATWKDASVVLPLVTRERNGKAEDHLLLTLRADDLRHHAGQVAFAGGRIDPDDADATAAALRELDEELQIPAQDFQPWGFLPCLLTITGYRVFPLVGRLQAGYTCVPAADEVAEVFEVPLSWFTNTAHQRTRDMPVGDDIITLYEYQYQGYRIWGATAGMIVALVRRLTHCAMIQAE